MAFHLDDPWERLRCFSLFYVCEGIPQGFTETFMPVYLKVANLSEADIGHFGARDAQPWAWKWVLAPFVDILWTRRRWLFATQVLMIFSLLPLAFFTDLKEGFQPVTGLVFVHNVFSATQDVAIDAIAVGALPLAEGPAADGMMFAAQELGNSVGGSAALWISGLFAPEWKYAVGCCFVSGVLALIFLAFTCRLRRDVGAGGAGANAGGFGRYLAGLRQAVASLRFWVAVLFACFPSGALVLRGPNCKSKMVADSMSEQDIAMVEFCGKSATIATMMAGGFLASGAGLLGIRVGPRYLVALAYFGTTCITLLAAWAMNPGLSMSAWVLIKVLFHLVHGLHIGPQMSLFRSCCSPAVAATQFTVFCSVCNWADSWGRNLTGQWIESTDFKSALWWDALLPVVPLFLLPLVGR